MLAIDDDALRERLKRRRARIADEVIAKAQRVERRG